VALRPQGAVDHARQKGQQEDPVLPFQTRLAQAARQQPAGPEEAADGQHHPHDHAGVHDLDQAKAEVGPGRIGLFAATTDGPEDQARHDQTAARQPAEEIEPA